MSPKKHCEMESCTGRVFFFSKNKNAKSSINLSWAVTLPRAVQRSPLSPSLQSNRRSFVPRRCRVCPGVRLSLSPIQWPIVCSAWRCTRARGSLPYGRTGFHRDYASHHVLRLPRTYVRTASCRWGASGTGVCHLFVYHVGPAVDRSYVATTLVRYHGVRV